MTDLSGYSDSQLAALAGDLDPDTDALVRTVYGEARNQDPIGRKAVAAVIRNRSKLSGQPISAVVREQGQFEPWGDHTTRQQLESLDPSSDAYQGILRDIDGDDDPTGGATHFYSPGGQKAKGRAPPKWDDGSGVDLGDHRFFKLAYGGQSVEPAQAPDIAELPDDELEAIARGDAPADAPTNTPAEDPIGDVEFISAPATAASARKSTVVDAEKGEAATPAQEAFFVGLISAGKLDPAKVRSGGYKSGSEEFPLLQRDAQDLPKPGDWYVTPEGEKRQVAEVPMLDTATSLARLIGQPGFAAAAAADPKLIDPRAAAMKRALESGVMLGGRNELIAGIESIPAMFEGGIPLVKERFGDALEREDKASAQARRDFPVAYDASAVAGGLTSGGLIPGGLVPRVATAAGSGFLATDGDVSRRAIGAGLGVVGGEALRLAAPRVAGTVMDMAGVPRNVGAPQIAAADEALQALGSRVDDLPPLGRARLERELRAGHEPADAAVLALNDSLPVEVPLRRGDVTGLPTDQINFNMSLRGARGAGPASDAQDIVARQQDALRANVDEIATGIRSPIERADIPVRGEGGVKVSDALTAHRTAAEADVNAKYNAAREGSGNAVLPRYDMEPLSGGMVDAVTTGHSLRDVPKVAGHLRDIQEMARAGDGSIRALYETRARLSSLRADGGAEAAAASKAIKAFDAKMNDAMSADLLSGDPAAVQNWKSAITARREVGEVFGQDDLIDRLTQKVGSGSERRLAVDPGDAANYIFGRSALGMVGRKNLYRDMEKVRDLLGADSDAWNALRAEAFVRMAGAGEGAMEGAAQQFSGAKFAKAWQKANTEDARLVGMLFNQEERARIDAFSGIASRVTGSVKGGDNPSNTAAALKYLGRLTSSTFAVGKAVPLLRDALVGIEEIANRATARAANRPTPRSTPRHIPMRGSTAAGGGYLGATVVGPPN